MHIILSTFIVDFARVIEVFASKVSELPRFLASAEERPEVNENLRNKLPK